MAGVSSMPSLLPASLGVLRTTVCDSVHLVAPLHTQVFHPGFAQEAVFEDTKHLVQSAVDGYNVCIFAYGQVRRRRRHGITRKRAAS